MWTNCCHFSPFMTLPLRFLTSPSLNASHRTVKFYITAGVNIPWLRTFTTASATIGSGSRDRSPASSVLVNFKFLLNIILKSQLVVNVIVSVILVTCVLIVCFNCEGLGHEARDCPCPVLCCICKEEGLGSVQRSLQPMSRTMSR